MEIEISSSTGNSVRGAVWPTDAAGKDAAAEDTRAAAAALRLEHTCNNPTNSIEYRLVFVPCRCQSRACEVCGVRKGLALRDRLLDVAGCFRKPAMLTLTVDRKNFASCQAAHEFVSSNGRIGLLMRRLGIKRWVWTLEFQQKTGDGWPHWHILADLSDCPSGRIDLDRAWSFWRDKWGIGGLDLQIRRRFHQARHAVNYITKYLIKSPKHGYPRWVLESRKVIRLVAASRNLGPLVSDGRSKPRNSSDRDRRPRGHRRLLVDRLAECGQRTTAMRQNIDAENEWVDSVFVGEVPVSIQQLVTMWKQDRLDRRVRVEEPVFGFKPGPVPVGVLTECHEALEVFDSISRSIKETGEDRKAKENIRSRCESLMAKAQQYARNALEGGYGSATA